MIGSEIAKELQLKLKPDKRHVSVDAQKSPATLAILVACWILNWSYTFVDLKQPKSRVKQIIEASRSSLLISKEDNVDFVLSRSAELATLSRLGFSVSVEDPGPYPFDDDTCYIMFTSGSTGTPKGVPICSSQVLKLVDWLVGELGVEESDVLTSVNPWYFDNSVFDIYVSLLSGASLVLVDIDAHKSSLNWVDYLSAARPTVWFSVPSLIIFLQSMGVFKSNKFDSLRLIIFGGEAYPKEQLRLLLRDQGEKTKYRSVYGPTETTCICSVTEVNDVELESDALFVSLGNFADFFNVGVSHTFKMENGEIAGELILGGSNVTQGYVNVSDDLDKFSLVAMSDGSVERYYRTGDLVSYNKELKAFCFLGRKDNQVKRAGVRIELEEIESRIESSCGTICIVDFDVNRSSDLCLLFKSTQTIDREKVISSCSSSLPHYMVPRAVFEVRDLPLNLNGKKDRKRAREVIVGLLGDD